MYAVTGITGKVGSAVGRTLLQAGRPVRAVARNPEKAKTWIDRGCEFAEAEMTDAAALSEAFKGTEAIFVLIPPMFDPTPGFPEAKAVFTAVKSAIDQAKPGRVVCLSTIGAQATQPNLLNQLGLMEQTLRHIAAPVAFLRAAWFMENFAYDIDPARSGGVFHSFLAPLDHPFPMVASADIGATAAELLQETWSGPRIVELEGPQRLSPNAVAAALGRTLGRAVTAAVIPRDQWEPMFRAHGMKNPTPRAQMLDGFNEGWIEFEGCGILHRNGARTLDEVLTGLAAA
jgi:NAD(P)H dehydrogenase (quinone)